tara:strand:+ start:2152 stop:2652 length:501 start_codon:yes stop_codon:yes gene_type:complete
MANEIRVQTSVQIVNDVSVANDGGAAGDYTNYALDVFSGQRSWGGSYTMNQEYSTSDVAYWSNAVVSEASSADGLDNSDWTELSAVTAGTLPATVHVVAVEYVSALGSPGTISITVSGEIFAVLDPGQAVVIPMEMGEAIADVKILAGAYTDGTHEATVNVLVAGV